MMSLTKRQEFSSMTTWSWGLVGQGQGNDGHLLFFFYNHPLLLPPPPPRPLQWMKGYVWDDDDRFCGIQINK